MHLPGPLQSPIRAAVGLAAAAADELKNLPDRAVELPMVAVSSVLQLSLRAQQRYTALTVRGEQVLSGQSPTEEPPPWATFDEPATPEQLHRAALNRLDSLVDSVDDSDYDDDSDDSDASPGARSESAGRHPSSQLIEELFGVTDPAADEPPATVTPIHRAAGRTSAPRKAAAKKAAAKKTTRKSAAKTPAKRAAAKEDTAGKQVNKPRDRAPSKFDDAD